MDDLSKLLKGPITEKQRKIVMAVVEEGSQRKAAAKLGMAQSSVSEAITRARYASVNPETENVSRVKELEKIISMQAESIERMRGTTYKLSVTPGETSSEHGHCRLIVPDSHGCYADEMAISAMFSDAEVIRPREVILLGDHLECGGFLAQHHTLGYVAQSAYTFEDDVSATNQFLDRLQSISSVEEIDYIEGNHECMTPEHEVLTSIGWVPIAEVTRDHLVATMNDQREVEWEKPLATVSYQYDDDLVTIQDSPFIRFAVTKKHRFWLYSQVNKLYCLRAGDMVAGKENSTYSFPMSLKNPQQEYGISDCEIQLAAWILTDGCLTGKVTIFQSKQDNFGKIRDILRNCGVQWTEVSRQRKPPIIDGVQCKTAQQETAFAIRSQDSKKIAKRLFGIDNYSYSETYKKTLPSWVHLLSQRQVGVFLESLIDGDGCRAGTAYTLYGEQSFLDQVQSILCVNGYRVSLSKKYSKAKQGHFHCLNITQRDRVKITTKTLKTERYCGSVYCLTMRNDNFVVRFRGRVHVTGNSRIEKWCVTESLRNSKDAAYLLQLFSANSVLSIEKRGIRWIRQGVFYDNCSIPATIMRGKCYFTHGSSTSKHAASVHVSRFGGNVVYGHTHRADFHMTRTVRDGAIGGWSPGCLCKLQPLWQHTNPTEWSHGYGLQLVEKDGSFLHINVPIIDGKSYLGPLFKAIK